MKVRRTPICVSEIYKIHRKFFQALGNQTTKTLSIVSAFEHIQAPLSLGKDLPYPRSPIFIKTQVADAANCLPSIHLPFLPHQENSDLRWGDWQYAQLNTYNSLPLGMDLSMRTVWPLNINQKALTDASGRGPWNKDRLGGTWFFRPLFPSFLLHGMQTWWPPLQQSSWDSERKAKGIIQSPMLW